MTFPLMSCYLVVVLKDDLHVHIVWKTKAFTFKNGGKSSWFDSHHRLFPHNHPFRRIKNDFLKDEIVLDGPPPKSTSQEVWTRVFDYPKVTDFEQTVPILGYRVDHN